MWQTKNISATTMLMATKLCRMVTWARGCLLPIKSHHQLMTIKSFRFVRSPDKWKSLYICYQTWQCEIYNEELFPKSYKALWSHGLARSHKKLDLLYLYHKAYGHQTLWSGEFLWEASTPLAQGLWSHQMSSFLPLIHKTFDHMVLQGHMTI